MTSLCFNLAKFVSHNWSTASAVGDKYFAKNSDGSGAVDLIKQRNQRCAISWLSPLTNATYLPRLTLTWSMLVSRRWPPFLEHPTSAATKASPWSGKSRKFGEKSVKFSSKNTQHLLCAAVRNLSCPNIFAEIWQNFSINFSVFPVLQLCGYFCSLRLRSAVFCECFREYFHVSKLLNCQINFSSFI